MNKMYFYLHYLFIISTITSIVASPVHDNLVISTTEASKEGSVDTEVSDTSHAVPQIYEMTIRSNVTNRFAETLVTSKVKNLALTARQATFSVVLPEQAFITSFVMEVGGKSYKAYIKEKEEAKHIYDKAVQSGQGAAHVAVSARDSSRFTVTVNVEPETKATFKLTYEELLRRKHDRYEIVLNIHPGQIVKELTAEVHVDENVPLKFVRTVPLRSGNEIEKNSNNLDPRAEIIQVNSSSAVVKFIPNVTAQKEFAKELKTKEGEGLSGQFVVQYDVERNSDGGEVLLNDGYFVHFFAPETLQHLPKQVVFVLDTSGSMSGNKIHQLIDAMQKILSALKAEDSFSVVEFSTDVNVWNIETGGFKRIPNRNNYGNLDAYLQETDIPLSVPANEQNIIKAKELASHIRESSLTNIIGGLEIALSIVKRTRESTEEFRQPLIIFLTDGLPNIGLSSTDSIEKMVTKLNSANHQTPIFSLSFGNGADKQFLRKLSANNLGFSRHIYDAADASLQLQDFYDQISSPLLKDLTFKYTENATETTKTNFPVFFSGSEIVVSGRYPQGRRDEHFVEGWRPPGVLRLKPIVTNTSSTSLERIWAYLTEKEILHQLDIADNKTELTKKALDIALKYSFVTPVSSLIVVKPNDTSSSLNTEDASSAIPPSGIPVGFNGGGVYYRSPSSGPSYGMSFRGGGMSARGGVPGIPVGFNGGGVYHSPSSSGSSYGMTSRGGGISARGGGYPSIRYVPHSFPDHYFPDRRYLPSEPISSAPSPPTTERFLDLVSNPASVTLPQLEQMDWFKSIKNKQGGITLGPHQYKLGNNATVVPSKVCSTTALNIPGTCKLLHQCPQSYSFLTDLLEFTKYFCDLEGYAGICCHGNAV